MTKTRYFKTAKGLFRFIGRYKDKYIIKEIMITNDKFRCKYIERSKNE